MEKSPREKRIDDFIADTRDDCEIIRLLISVKDLSSTNYPTFFRMMQDATTEAAVAAYRKSVDWHRQEIERLMTAGKQQEAFVHRLAIGFRIRFIACNCKIYDLALCLATNQSM